MTVARSALLDVQSLAMGGWRVQTPAKLNLFLEVNRKREDGFHDITTLMLGVDWFDTLHVERARQDAFVITSEDAQLAATTPSDDSNLVLRALQRFRELKNTPPLHVRLHKSIPHGAGLGGGSGNAAGMLWLLNTAFGSPLDAHQVRELGGELGSDVPFFMGLDGESASDDDVAKDQPGGAMLATGRGEQLDPLSAPLFGGDRPYFVVVAPRIA